MATWYGKDELVLMAVIHVDDTMLAGTPEWIKWFKDDISKRFNYTDQGHLSKHLGISYEWFENADGDPYIIATMQKNVRQIIEIYEDFKGEKVPAFDMPGIPGISLKRTGKMNLLNLRHIIVLLVKPCI